MAGPRHDRGSVLVAVLWCVVLLSVIVLGLLHTTRMDLRLVKNYGDRIQAHYLALAGIEKARAVLYHDCVTRRQSATSHTGAVYDDPADFRDVELGRGRFSVLRPGGSDDSASVLYGVNDEESRLNVNTISTNEFAKIPNFPAPVAAAIMDWRDPDDQISPGGAEREYYASLQPPSEPRNGPLQTIRELLMVRGVSQELLLGDDSKPGASEELSSELGGFLDGGWASLFTVQSTDKNISADGKDRINLQTADEAALTGVQGITSAMAQAIVAYRGRQQFDSIANLLDVKASQPNNPDAGTNGPALISERLFQDTADNFTVDNSADQPGLVNINTAGAVVLACLPGIDANLAHAIISRRQSNGFFPNIAGLLEVPGMTRDIFKQLAPLITARSETFRIIAEGRIASSGALQRIEATVHISPHEARVLAYREDL